MSHSRKRATYKFVSASSRFALETMNLPNKMNATRIQSLCAAFTIFISCANLRAGNDFEKQIAGNFFMPEQILKSKDIINYSEEQQTTLRDAADSAMQKINSLNEILRAESEKFAELTKPRKLDEKAVLAQGDKVFAAEQEVKRAQMALLIFIKNNLTPEQQAKLSGLKSLDSKMNQVKQLAEKWKADGKDLSQFEPMKSEFETDVKEGKSQEAEALLDRVLQILNGTGGK
jgi:Spy/CpxP family protein refolding chaperone